MSPCSLLVSTYNWPEALDLCLQSILRQKQLPGEVLIADDGSSGKTAALISKYQSIFPVPLHHIWQPDRGFCKTPILNKAVSVANYPYIIQVDGDVLLDPHFITDHLRIAKKGYFVRGSRSLLNKELTDHILKKTALPSVDFLRSNCHHKLNAIRNSLLSRLLRFYRTKGKNKYRLIGCNLAYWRPDFIKINGYNEEMTGWGCEDKELAARLIKAGVKMQKIKMAGVVFHLSHPARSKENLHLHNLILNKAIQSDGYTCTLGVAQYTSFSLYTQDKSPIISPRKMEI